MQLQKICSVQMSANASIPETKRIPGLSVELAADIVPAAANTILAMLFNGMTGKLQNHARLESRAIQMEA